MVMEEAKEETVESRTASIRGSWTPLIGNESGEVIVK